jgi:hypothetical protein
MLSSPLSSFKHQKYAENCALEVADNRENYGCGIAVAEQHFL